MAKSGRLGKRFAGILISQTAEESPRQIKKLIYAAAFIPNDEERLLSKTQAAPQSRIGQNLRVNEKEGKAAIAKEGAIEIFRTDAPKHIGHYIASTVNPNLYCRLPHLQI